MRNLHAISLHRLNTFLRTKLGLFLVLSSFLLAGSSFWTKRSGTTTCSPVALFIAVLLRKKELSGCGTVPCSAKLTQHSSAADWNKFSWRHRIGSDGTRTEQLFIFEVKLCIWSYIDCKLFDIVNYSLNHRSDR